MLVRSRTSPTALSCRSTFDETKPLPNGERRLAAIMFTDIQGYTTMAQNNEAEALKMLRRYRSIVGPIITKFKGREVKTMGDGSLIEFGSALEASGCAVEMQKVLHDFNQTAITRIPVRVGIHVGDVIHSSGDIYGDAVNIASRIEPLAAAGGISISGQVYYQIRNKLPYNAVRVESSELKNVSSPTEVYRLELPWEDPGTMAGRRFDRRRLAVLPMDNISPDPNDEYFATGLTDELISALSRVKGLEVIARTSVLRYKSGAKQVATIGNELHVGSVLEGSVRKAGNRIRVTAQLINTANEAHVWSDTYDRQLDDIFAVQSDIAGKVAGALRLELSSSEAEELRPTSNLEAYTLYLKGRFATTKLNVESMLKGIGDYEKAVALAPDFASCYAGLAQAWLVLGFFELVSPQDAFPKSKHYATKALELDDKLAEGHVAMGRLLRMHEWKFVEAERELKLATELDPNSATAHAYRAQALLTLERNTEAEAEAKRALELDPFSVLTCQILGTIYLYSERYDDAIELYGRALEINPNSPFPLGNLGLAYVQKGSFDRGISLIEKASEIEGSTPSTKNDLAYAYEKAGRRKDVERVLTELLEMRKESQRAAPAIAGVYATLGDYNKAFEWLEKAIAEHSAYLFLINRDFVYDPLRSDPRYKDFIKRIGLSLG